MNVGDTIGDAIRNIQGQVIGVQNDSAGHGGPNNGPKSSGTFIGSFLSSNNTTSASGHPDHTTDLTLRFDASNAPGVLVAYENRPVATSAYLTITY